LRFSTAKSVIRIASTAHSAVRARSALLRLGFVDPPDDGLEVLDISR